MITELLSLRWLTPSRLVFIAGMLQFCQVPALFFAPKMLGWEEDLVKLRPINQAIFKVIGGAIVLIVLGMGIVVMVDPDTMVSGNRLGMAVSAFLGAFWLYRGGVQAVVYPRIWPGGFMGRASHFGLLALFTFQCGVYMMAFFFSLAL